MRRKATKIGVTILGPLFIIGGALMLVLPGPGLLTILAGLAILGIEYHWARRLHRYLQNRFINVARKAHPANWKTKAPAEITNDQTID